MALQTLDRILTHVTAQPSWKGRWLFQRLQTLWPALVGPSVMQHTHPIAIQRQILQVATSTPSWSQTLSFERVRLLRKINQHPDLQSLNLRDIHFSTAQWEQWQRLLPQIATLQEQAHWQNHPSRLMPLHHTSAGSSATGHVLTSPPPLPVPTAPLGDRPYAPTPYAPTPYAPTPCAPTSAFEQWASRRRQQLRWLPRCPECQTPAPFGELQRWQRCGLCERQARQAQHQLGWMGEQREESPTHKPTILPARTHSIDRKPRPVVPGAGKTDSDYT